MDNVHGAHGTTGIVKDPFLVEVDEAAGRRLGVQLVDYVADNRARVVAVGSDAALGQAVQPVGREDVKRLEVGFEKVDERAEDANEQRKEGENARHGGGGWVCCD